VDLKNLVKSYIMECSSRHY